MLAETLYSSMMISPICIVVAAGMFALWVFLAPWMNADAVAVQANRKLYVGLFLGAGALGMILTILAGLGIGIGVYAAGIIGVMAAYTMHRNKLVDVSYQIFTKEWFA